jgi:hypothetical protein
LGTRDFLEVCRNDKSTAVLNVEQGRCNELRCPGRVSVSDKCRLSLAVDSLNLKNFSMQLTKCLRAKGKYTEGMFFNVMCKNVI